VGQDENYGPRYIYHHKGTHTHFLGNHIVLGFKYAVVLLMGTGTRMETYSKANCNPKGEEKRLRL
jgi:hypothetical protein